MKVEDVIVGWYIQYNGTDEDGEFCGCGAVIDKDVENRTVCVCAPLKNVTVPEDCIFAMGPTIGFVCNEQALMEFLDENKPDVIIDGGISPICS